MRVYDVEKDDTPPVYASLKMTHEANIFFHDIKKMASYIDLNYQRLKNIEAKEARVLI